jgi:hypothetical protein
MANNYNNTYTTDWQSISDGDTTTINPTDLINVKGAISIKNPEVQWRGKSDITTGTDDGQRYNSDTGSARIETTPYRNTNSAYGETTTDNEYEIDSFNRSNSDEVNNADVAFDERTETDRFSETERNQKDYIDAGDSVTIQSPSIPANATGTIDVNIQWELIETGGYDEYDINLKVDKDITDTSSEETIYNLSVEGDSSTKIPVYSQTIDVDDYKNNAEAISAEITKEGDNLGTQGVRGTVSISGNTQTTSTERVGDSDYADAAAPTLPDGVQGNVDVEIRYYVVETSGGDDSGIKVGFDDDPYNYSVSRGTRGFSDTIKDNIYIAGDSEKEIFSTTETVSVSKYEDDVDGAQIELLENPDEGYSNFGTAGVRAEIEVSGERRSFEGVEVDREFVTSYFPPAEKGEITDLEVKIESNFGIDERYSVGDGSGLRLNPVISRRSGPDDGDFVRITTITHSETRETIYPTLSVEYPSVPTGYDFDNHDINRDGYGDSFEEIYSNKEGEKLEETVTSITPSDGEVELELKTEYSKPTRSEDKTSNPSIDENLLERDYNTDKVLFVIDKSESVSGSNRKNVAKEVLSSLSDTTTTALLSFNFDSELNVPPRELDEGNPSQRDVMKAAIDNLPATGGTDIQQAVQFARDNFSSDDPNVGTIVLITDGNNYTDAAELVPQFVNFDFISIGVSNNIDTNFLQNLTSLLDGDYFNSNAGSVELSTRLNNNSLSSWKPLTALTEGEQTLTHSIEESKQAEFRVRFDWKIDTPEPIYGTTGFYDESVGVWRECVVTDVNSNSLEYNHVTVYNDDEEDWGALDVVDTTNSAAIEAFAFYDEDAGWLAPREYNTV